MRRKLTLCAGALAVVALIGACSGSDREESAALRAAEGGQGGGTDDMAFAPDSGGRNNFGTAHGALDSTLPPVGPAVIKTADVTVEVDEGDLQDAVRRIVAVARAHGGFVLSTSVEDEGARSGTIVVRIPSDAFEDALADAEEVGDVTREQVAGEDVSQEFVDLDARLRNFEAQESVLLDLMAKSESVADTLRVQRELQSVQLEIERLRGRLRFLRDQTDLSTITITLREGQTTVAATGLIARAWQRAVDTFNAIVAAVVVGLSVALPIGLLLALLLLVARFIRPRLPSWGPRHG
jgi:hypothetical protein